VPPFARCLAAMSAASGTGVAVLGELADRLRQECSALATALDSSAVRTSLETYRRRDGDAVREQGRLMREAARANVCTTGAGLTSALVLAASGWSEGGERALLVGRVTLVLGFVILALGAAGAFFQSIARDQGRVARWQTSRGEAELARLGVFTAVATKAAAQTPAVALYALALVVRHLVDDQRQWFSARARRHQASSETTSRWAGCANALAFIGGSGAVIASQNPGSTWIVLAGVVSAAIAAYASNRDALLRDRANADRYEKTRVVLDGLAGRTDDIAARIAAGEPQAVVAFTEAVTDLLATEHKQWLEGTAQAEALLGKLDGALKNLGGPAR
jgi:uncharacterized membrane protein HdeD (DUF308 family)